MKSEPKQHSQLLKRCLIIAIVLLVVVLICELLLTNFNTLFGPKHYTAQDFGIQTLKSPYDKDGDGIDDYRDMMFGARAISTHAQSTKVHMSPAGIRQKESAFAPMSSGVPFRQQGMT